jgi:hypothetical protein
MVVRSISFSVAQLWFGAVRYTPEKEKRYLRLAPSPTANDAFRKKRKN